MEGQRVEIPTPAEKLKCKHRFKKLRRPFVFFVDFESTQEIEEPEGENII